MTRCPKYWQEFREEVALHKRIWTIRDEGGFPAPKNSEGAPAQPFWSSLERVERIIKRVKAYKGFSPHELSWEDFRDKWIPGLERDEILVGVNWCGARCTGFDIEPAEVLRVMQIEIERLERRGP